MVSLRLADTAVARELWPGTLFPVAGRRGQIDTASLRDRRLRSCTMSPAELPQDDDRHRLSVNVSLRSAALPAPRDLQCKDKSGKRSVHEEDFLRRRA
jgi:hypothetical protein